LASEGTPKYDGLKQLRRSPRATRKSPRKASRSLPRHLRAKLPLVPFLKLSWAPGASQTWVCPKGLLWRGALVRDGKSPKTQIFGFFLRSRPWGQLRGGREAQLGDFGPPNQTPAWEHFSRASRDSAALPPRAGGFISIPNSPDSGPSWKTTQVQMPPESAKTCPGEHLQNPQHANKRLNNAEGVPRARFLLCLSVVSRSLDFTIAPPGVFWHFRVVVWTHWSLCHRPRPVWVFGGTNRGQQ